MLSTDDLNPIIHPEYVEQVIQSLKKTGRIVITGDASTRGSFMKEMAQTISELAFDELDAPPVVVGSRNWIVPAHELEQHFFPQAGWIVDAIHEKNLPLEGHTVTTDWSDGKILSRNRKGV